MDPHTGEVLALVGGRNYAFSQLDHAVAKRPTGSIFKPFVYAAAMNTALDGSNPVITPASMVDDEPTTFTYGDQIYEPRNYKEEYHGEVTARYALAMSLNNATVKVAEEVGYDKVADSGPGCRNHLGEANSCHGPGRLRCHPARYGVGLYRLCQWRTAHLARAGEFGAQRQRRRDSELHA